MGLASVKLIFFQKTEKDLIHTNSDSLELTNANSSRDSYGQQSYAAILAMWGQQFDAEINARNQEIVRLKREKEEILESKNKEIAFMRNMMINLGHPNVSGVSRVNNIEDETNTADSSRGRTVVVPDGYVYDVFWFGKNVTSEERNAFIDMLVALFHTNISIGEPLISSQADVAYVCILVIDYAKYIKNGDVFVGDLGDLCKLINSNVIPTIENQELRDALTCNYGTVNASISDTKFKNTNPRKWMDLYAEDKQGQKKKLKRAINIFDRMKK